MVDAMDYRPLGNSGLLVSRVGLGCNNFGGRTDLEASRAVVRRALEEGITFFDTADMYGGAGRSEEFLGVLLEGHRDEVVLATKFGHADVDMGFGPAAGAKGGRAYVRRAVEASLRRLKTDYIDLYQLHTPDLVTPIAETLAALHELVVEGKVRYLGHSNFSGWQLAEAAHTADELGVTPFVSAQNHWSLLDREIERELVPAAEHYGVGVIPFFPLAQGLLTGKVHSRDTIAEGTRLHERAHLVTDERLDRVEALTVLADKLGRSLLDLAIGGLAARAATGSVIAGATKPEQVTANVKAGSWAPTADELAAIDEVVPPPDQ
jgi:aryl-alcohol dehydrogenase-like predicted oxidoreductase